MNSDRYPMPPRRLPAVIYKSVNGIQAVHPVYTGTNLVEMIDAYKHSPGIASVEAAYVEAPGWRNAKAMDLNTGNKSFDSKHCYLGTGNVISETMTGTFVRPRAEVTCKGHSFAPGSLQLFDLQRFNVSTNFPHERMHAQAMVNFIRTDPRFETQTCQAYVIYHFEDDIRIVHGAMVTETSDRLIRLFHRADLGLPASAASAAVMSTARRYLTDERISGRKTVWQMH